MTSIHVRRLRSRVARTTARYVELARRDGLSVAELVDVRLPWYEIRNQAGGDDEPATVLIYDEIGGSLGISAEQFARDLEAITAPTVHVRINSPGGSVFDAIAIHNSLRHHRSRIEVYVDGLAASAASVIAMAGDEIVMMPGSQMMIHDASMVEDGNAADHAKAVTFLDRQSDNIADMYRQRAGGEATEWRELMKAETWYFAVEAVEAGLADRAEGQPPELETEVQERMARSFDLSQYRYRGREQAPAPARRHTTRQRRDQDKRVQVTAVYDEQLREAGARRRAAVAEGRTLLDAPPGGHARSVCTEWMRRSSRPTKPDVPAMPKRLTVKQIERDGKPFHVVEGYYTVYERGYEMWDEYGPYVETVGMGAGEKTTAANPDVIFLVNHRGLAMARTTAGTLELWSDDIGGGNRAWLNPQRQDVKDLVLGIDDKTITEQSFSFMIVSGRWNSDYTQYRIEAYDLDRGDNSAVNYGANPSTSIAARAREILDELEHLPTGAARAALERLTHRADLASARSAAPVPAQPQPEPDRDQTDEGVSMTAIAAWLQTVETGA